MKIIEIKITNPDAKPSEQIIYVDEHSANRVCEWYASHCAGDRYKMAEINRFEATLSNRDEPQEKR